MSFEDQEDTSGKPIAAASEKRPEYIGGYAVNERGEVILTDKEADVAKIAQQERSS